MLNNKYMSLYILYVRSFGQHTETLAHTHIWGDERTKPTTGQITHRSVYEKKNKYGKTE